MLEHSFHLEQSSNTVINLPISYYQRYIYQDMFVCVVDKYNQIDKFVKKQQLPDFVSLLYE